MFAKERFMKMPGMTEELYREHLEDEEKRLADIAYRSQFTEVNPEYWGLDPREIKVFVGGNQTPGMDGSVPPPYVIAQHIPSGFYAMDMTSKSQIKGKIECLRTLSSMKKEWKRLKTLGLQLRGSEDTNESS